MRPGYLLTAFFCFVAMSLTAQPLSLDSCRAMALANNKQMRIGAERIKAAQYRNKAAVAAYLPALDFAGGYVYNGKKLSVFDSDRLLPTKSFNASTGKYEYNLVSNPVTGEPVKSPDGQYVPSTVAMIPKDAMTYDIHNVFFGAVTLTQPVYMGGKIMAMNRITHYAEELARRLRDSEAENVVYAVDGAYWTVVSLKAKQRLAGSYVALLDTLCRNVKAMVAEGVSTRSEQLSVEVKLNQAQVDMAKVENALVLSRMSLAQLCGLPVDSRMELADEDVPSGRFTGRLLPASLSGDDMEEVYSRRNDVRALELQVRIYEQEQRVALSLMLPNVALTGSYSFSNPNMYDGFRNRFDGAFSVGVAVKIPLWHWGGNYNGYRASKVETVIRCLELEDAKEKIALQVSQARFRYREAERTYRTTLLNLDKAGENLENARLGFREGVLAADNVMEAQTAWLKANSEKIDAGIDVMMCNAYLQKSLGELLY